MIRIIAIIAVVIGIDYGIAYGLVIAFDLKTSLVVCGIVFFCLVLGANVHHFTGWMATHQKHRKAHIRREEQTSQQRVADDRIRIDKARNYLIELGTYASGLDDGEHRWKILQLTQQSIDRMLTDPSITNRHLKSEEIRHDLDLIIKSLRSKNVDDPLIIGRLERARASK